MPFRKRSVSGWRPKNPSIYDDDGFLIKDTKRNKRQGTKRHGTKRHKRQGTKRQGTRRHKRQGTKRHK